MEKDIVYLLQACYRYSGSVSICAFYDKEKADVAAKEANEYILTKPKAPDDPKFSESEWEDYEKRFLGWVDRHPYKEGSLADYFEVVEIEVI